MSPIEVEAIAAGHGARLADGRPPVRHERGSDRQDHPDRGRALPGRGREREERLDARPVAGQLRDHPARPVRDAVRVAAIARSPVKPRDVSRSRGGAGRSDGRPARRAAAQPEAARQLRHVHVRHDPGHLPVGDQRHLRGARRRRGAVARRRGHRHHEHHADGRERADARDRPAQGARREAVATSCRRCSPSRSCCRCSAASWARSSALRRAGGLSAHADSGDGRNLGGGAGHHDHGARRPVLRPVSGLPRGARSIRSKR